MNEKQMINYDDLPESLQGGMQRYVEEGIRPGGFLSACLKNDLYNAVVSADPTNTQLTTLNGLVEWMQNNLPNACWGDELHFNSWLAERRQVQHREDNEETFARLEEAVSQGADAYKADA